MFSFPILNLEIASGNEMRDILFWFVFASSLCPNCSVVYSCVKYRSPIHWLCTELFSEQRNQLPNLSPSLLSSLPPFLSPSLPPFFSAFPFPFSHFSSHPTALCYIAVVALWKYYFINCKHNKISVMTNDPSVFLLSPINGCSIYCAVMKNRRVCPLQKIIVLNFP